MEIFLPIADVAIFAEIVFLISALVGFLSGVFGIGGGFLITPILIAIGIPPAVAVGTQSSQLVASSMSGVMGHWSKRNVDLKIALVMLLGGFIGSIIGIFVFQMLNALGKIDLAISMLYIVLLGSIGILMLSESLSKLFFAQNSYTKQFNTIQIKPWISRLPYKMRFPRSHLYISALIPGGIGLVGGVLASVLGIGGGFLLVPAMIYILGMPIALIAGTVLFQMIFTTAFATLMHATANGTVDIVLAAVLILGAVIGAQAGVGLAGRVKPLMARLTLAFIVLSVCISLIAGFFVEFDLLSFLSYSYDGEGREALKDVFFAEQFKDVAENYGFSYGLVCIAFALSMGWLSYKICRRK